MKKISILTLFAIYTVTQLHAQINWKFDKAHSGIGFSVKHLVISDATGYFKEFDGTVSSARDNNFDNAKIEFTVKTASIFTDNEQRDKHLRSDDFFNSEKFPDMKFVGKSMKKTSGNKYVLTGDLTIRDKTKQVKLDVIYNGTVKDPWGNTKAGFKLNGVIDRFDFDLKWNTAMEAGGLVVGKKVAITCNVELALQK